ncbi:MAG: Rrf2 family transcriptional regulator [Gemmatimonadota bacterium]|nr:Rrf2 family transcriptional regulator [Gemmatimonadota bacterium]
MKLSASEEYGLRCLLQIGRRQRETGGGLTISEISRFEGLSVPNVAKLMRILRLGGFVESSRGQSGGYRLTRPADMMVVGDVLTALGGRMFNPEFCEDHAGREGLCTHSVDCSIRSLWTSIQSVIDQILSRVTLEDLLGDEQAMDACMQNVTEELIQVSG